MFNRTPFTTADAMGDVSLPASPPAQTQPHSSFLDAPYYHPTGMHFSYPGEYATALRQPTANQNSTHSYFACPPGVIPPPLPPPYPPMMASEPPHPNRPWTPTSVEMAAEPMYNALRTVVPAGAFKPYYDSRATAWVLQSRQDPRLFARGVISQAERKQDRIMCTFNFENGDVKKYYLCFLCMAKGANEIWIGHKNFVHQHIPRNHARDLCLKCPACHQSVFHEQYTSHLRQCAQIEVANLI